MWPYRRLFDRADTRITAWMDRNGVILLRVSVGIVSLWFGFLKFFPGLSPAQDLALRTIDSLTFGLLPPRASIVMLAAWETIIGLGLLFGVFMRGTLLLLFLQMLGTLTPLLFFPSEGFTRPSYVPTLEGQYTIKNLVLFSAGIGLVATVRGGRITETQAVTPGCSKPHPIAAGKDTSYCSGITHAIVGIATRAKVASRVTAPWIAGSGGLLRWRMPVVAGARSRPFNGRGRREMAQAATGSQTPASDST